MTAMKSPILGNRGKVAQNGKQGSERICKKRSLTLETGFINANREFGSRLSVMQIPIYT